MEKEAVRDTVQSFADAVEAMGFQRNVGTGKVVPLPSDPDDKVATYKHEETGRRVCVWPVRRIDEQNRLDNVAAHYGFRFVQLGRPTPKEGA